MSTVVYNYTFHFDKRDSHFSSFYSLHSVAQIYPFSFLKHECKEGKREKEGEERERGEREREGFQ
jgi:hypothetical protein